MARRTSSGPCSGGVFLGSALRSARRPGRLKQPRSREPWQRPWQHPDRPIRPYRPHAGTIRTIWHGTDGYDPRVARLRAWSGITGWRFESCSAHAREAPRCGAFSLPGRSRGGGELSRQRLLANGDGFVLRLFPHAEAPMSVHFEASSESVRGRWREDGAEPVGPDVEVSVFRRLWRLWRWSTRSRRRTCSARRHTAGYGSWTAARRPQQAGQRRRRRSHRSSPTRRRGKR